MKHITVRRTTPEPISHYTDLAGLAGIVREGELWASDVEFLNDRREVLHGLEASVSAIRNVLSDKEYSEWKTALSKAQMRLKVFGLPSTYAVCFCRSGDLLSQWRGYGGLEQGVSIQFSRRDLTRILQLYGASYHQVVYCNATASIKVTEALRSQMTDLLETEEILGQFDEKERTEQAYNTICRILPQFKDFGFRDEREARYIIQGIPRNLNLFFRVRRNVLVPFLKLQPPSPKILPIQSVTVGPGPEQPLTIRSVELLLKEHGHHKTQVVASSVPFRV